MKTIARIVLAALALGAPLVPAIAAEKKQAGPHGGRLIAGLEPRAEFFVTADKKIQISFVAADGKTVVAPTKQVVTVTMGDRAKPTRLEFARSGDALLSTAAIPAGKDLATVVQIKPSADAKIVTDRFNLDLSKCPDCKLHEYACTCAH
ncbi:MAG: hypothetical protein JNL39_18065 [Opitutaceae bacterium]|nr:hypothetical protein [Opitutaceae bacterium]